jgi:hypothetical protein
MVPNELPSDAETTHGADTPPRTFWLLAGLIVTLSFTLNLFHLTQPTVWLDEAVSWRNVSTTWSNGWKYACQGEDCGGFAYLVFLKLISARVGYSALALRLPSVLLGVGFLAIMMRLARGLWGRTAALIIGILVALHPETVCWFRQARGYGLELFAVGWFLVALIGYARSGHAIHAVSLCAAACVTATTHVFGSFVVGGAALFLLIWRVRRNRSASSLVRAGAGMWPVILPMLLNVWWLGQIRTRVSENLDEFWIHGSWLANYWCVLQEHFPPSGWSLLLMVAGVAGLAYRRADVSNRVALGVFVCAFAVVLVGPALPSLAAHGSHNFILPRYFLPLVALNLLPITYLLARLPRPCGIFAAVALGVIGLAGSHSEPLYDNDGYSRCDSRGGARFINERLEAQDRVFVCPAYHNVTLEYYHLPPNTLLRVNNAQELAVALEKTRLELGLRRIWLLDYDSLPAMDRPTWFFGRLKIVQLR